METALSKPLTELPPFLSAVSMVGDDKEQTIRELTHAERPSPAVYRPARELFIRVLKGDFDFEQALREGGRLPDKTERKYACEVLDTSKPFLAKEPNARIAHLGPMQIILPNRVRLGVSPVWIRHLPEPRLLVLHFWERALSDWQLSAAAAILISALRRHNPALLPRDLDFVSVAIPAHSASRRLRVYDWSALTPLDEDDLGRFLDRLSSAWDEYQRRGPRVFKRRRNNDLFEC